MRWACAVTTVGNADREWAAVGYRANTTQRRRLLGRTMGSLGLAGFPKPHLFVDGAKSGFSCSGVPVTYRWPAVLTWANWFLSLGELVARNPLAHRYGMFQDDFVCCRNLRAYLDACPYPDGSDGNNPGYWNLYTFPENESRNGYVGWEEAPVIDNSGGGMWQAGRGAVALVFDRAAALAVLKCPTAWNKLFAVDPEKRCKRADGGIVTAMNWSGFSEYVHTPSLVQHTGTESSMANGRWGTAPSFPGEDFDALELRRHHGASAPA